MLGKKWLFGPAAFLCGMAWVGVFPGEEGEDPWAYRPNDPAYQRMWHLFSHVPKDQRERVSDWDAEHGSGMHVDRAWQLHTGRADTVVAILDSGIIWDEPDLIDQYHLNRAELPMPEGSVSYDANRDGRFSVSDYRADSRVSDKNSNGYIDPEDLIMTFSDGRDDDANGFVDDIAGWDFHENDNNPGDRTLYGHGTDEAKNSTAGLNNGIGGAGICGGCQFFSVRLNDSFIVDGQAFAKGVRFATQSGADVIQNALGALNHSPDVSEAVNAAYDHGVVTIGSAADEHSFHHNFPATVDPIVYTNSIRHDDMEYADSTTFVNFNNCSNFGARVDVATAGLACSSEATGNLSGITALAISYSKELGRRITPGSMISLIKSTADDVNLGEGNQENGRWSTYEGWDTFTGFGRTNAFHILDAIRRNRIPAEARIRAPQWFANVDPAADAVSVRIDARPATAGEVVVVELEVGHGVELEADKFRKVYHAEIAGGTRGLEVSIPMVTLRSLARSKRDAERNKYAYTLQLRVATAGKLPAVARRTFFVRPEEDATVWRLQGSGEPGAVMVDIDADGIDEFVTADGHGGVYARNAGGSLSGFPVQASSGVFAPISVGDIDASGKSEIVLATVEGTIEVFRADGSLLTGFPVHLPAVDKSATTEEQVIDHGILAAPTLVDLNGDGKLAIVIPGLDGLLHAYDWQGQVVEGFPYAAIAGGRKAKLMSSPAAGDLNGDGLPELVFGSNHKGDAAGYLFIFDSTTRKLLSGNSAARVPLIRDEVFPTIGTGLPTAPVLADLDRDGSLDILIHGFVGKMYLFSAEGRFKRSFSMNPSSEHGIEHEISGDRLIPAFGNPGLVRWDDRLYPTTVGVGSRMLLAVVIGGKRVEFQHMFGVWDPDTGAMLNRFPQPIDDMMLGMSATAIDLNGDQQDELLISSGGYFIRGFDKDGPRADLDRFTGGWVVRSPVTGDWDGDGLLEIAATTREGYAFVWETEFATRPATWQGFKGGPKRHGLYREVGR